MVREEATNASTVAPCTWTSNGPGNLPEVKDDLPEVRVNRLDGNYSGRPAILQRLWVAL